MSETYSPEALDLCSETGLRVYAQRSLSGEGTKTLLGAAFTVAVAAGGVAVCNRAWPVVAFLIAMPAALTLAFSANNRDARAFELLRFQGNDFEISRIDKYGRLAERITLPAWQTRFSSEGNAEDGLSIFATGPSPDGHRKTHPIAAFLSPGEKAELLRLLKEAQSFRALAHHRQQEIREAMTTSPHV